MGSRISKSVVVYKHFVPTALKQRLSTMSWVGRRELNPHGPQSQCGALPIELRPTQKGDKESSVTRHLADVVTLSIRPELAGTTRLELANQLIENQSAFHFAFIPVIVVRVER